MLNKNTERIPTIIEESLTTTCGNLMAIEKVTNELLVVNAEMFLKHSIDKNMYAAALHFIIKSDVNNAIVFFFRL